MNDKRVIKAPTGTQLQAKSWLTEAPLRMLMNNLDPDVAERPEDLVVYGGIGKAARNWDAYDAMFSRPYVMLRNMCPSDRATRSASRNDLGGGTPRLVIGPSPLPVAPWLTMQNVP